MKYLGARVAVICDGHPVEGWVVLTLGGPGAAEVLGVELPNGWIVFRTVRSLYGGVP